MAVLTWNANETEPVEPFATSAEALTDSGLRLTSEGVFSSEEVHTIEDPSDWVPASPEVQIVVDERRLSADALIDSEELVLALVVRDRELNRFVLVDRWPVKEIPAPIVDLRQTMDALSRSGFFDVELCVFPRSDRDRGQGVARRSGQVVARKTFRVRQHPKRSNFPKIWKDPEAFIDIGLPEDTIFWIDWLGEDLNNHPQDTFVVWLNKSQREQLLSFEFGGASGRLLALNLSASILCEIASAVLASDQDATEPYGTLRTIADELGEVSGLDLDGMRAKFRNHNGSSLLRAWVHEKLEVARELRGLAFGR